MDNIHSTIGYHGLPREYVAGSISSQTIHESTKNNEWLGRGVYFFQYLDHAKWWITHERYKGRETAILQAQLTYSDEQLLDLDNPSERKSLDDFFRSVLSQPELLHDKLSLPDNPTMKQKWCFACNFIRLLKPEIGIIIYTFPRPQEKSNLYPSNQRQICVSQNSIISDIKEVNLQIC